MIRQARRGPATAPGVLRRAPLSCMREQIRSGVEAVDEHGKLDPALAQAIVGYLNFSDGRPEPRWQRQVNDAFAQLARSGDRRPWHTLLARLRERLVELRAGGSS